VCQTCDAGFSLTNQLCSPCTATEFYNFGTSNCQSNFSLSHFYKYIIDCPTHCTTCTDLNTCQSCEANTGLHEDMCKSCPAKTFLQGGICERKFFHYFIFLSFYLACPITCATCNDATHCTACEATFGLQNDLCVPCPAKTYLLGSDCIGKFNFALNIFLNENRMSR